MKVLVMLLFAVNSCFIAAGLCISENIYVIVLVLLCNSMVSCLLWVNFFCVLHLRSLLLQLQK